MRFWPTIAWLTGSLLCTGCDDPSVPTPARSSSARASSSAILAARLPTRRVYLQRAQGRCSTVLVSKKRRTKVQDCGCPRTLRDGERLRLSGRVCFRESSTAARNQPVRCPADILIAGERLGNKSEAGRKKL